MTGNIAVHLKLVREVLFAISVMGFSVVSGTAAVADVAVLIEIDVASPDAIKIIAT